MKKNRKAGTIIGCVLLLILVVGVIIVYQFGDERIQVEEEVDTGEAFTKYTVIAQSLGSIDDKTGTNSLEALEQSYENGVRLFDADVCLLKDDTLALRHDWTTDMRQKALKFMLTTPYGTDVFGQASYEQEAMPTAKQFTKNKMYGKYTPMLFEDLAEWLQEHDDAYIVCDVRQNTKSIYEKIYKLLSEMDESLLDQIVVECYNEEELKLIQEIYPFSNVMIRKTSGNALTFHQLVNLTREYHIQAVSVSKEYAKDYGVLRLKSAGVKIYWDTVDDEEEFQESYAVDGIVSNTLTEEAVK